MLASAKVESRSSVFDIVAAALRDADVASLARGDRVDDETPLYGAGSPLDSLSLVLLVCAVEDGVRERLGADVVLASERAMSMRHSPYRTVGSFVQFIESELAAA